MITLIFRAFVVILCSLCTFTYAGEADVVDVSIQPLGDNRYQISVTLSHADTGWEHYANAWEVLDEEGQLIGERILYHPHVNEQPFTRSLTVTIAPEIKKISLRGKDNVHGYGGKIIQVPVPIP